VIGFFISCGEGGGGDLKVCNKSLGTTGNKKYHQSSASSESVLRMLTVRTHTMYDDDEYLAAARG
jgi:hypothetical protein